jgi:uncharacterized cupin superfamily protein
MFRLGKLVGAERTGATVYELPPGELLCPYHYEYGEEEWLLVLSGRPFLRTPEGTEELKPLDLAFFPRGPEGAHQVGNRTDEPARVLMWSDVVWPTGTEYPDSDKVGLWLAPGNSRWWSARPAWTTTAARSRSARATRPGCASSPRAARHAARRSAPAPLARAAAPCRG